MVQQQAEQALLLRQQEQMLQQQAMQPPSQISIDDIHPRPESPPMWKLTGTKVGKVDCFLRDLEVQLELYSSKDPVQSN